MSYANEVLEHLRTGKYRLEMHVPSVPSNIYFKKYILVEKETGKADPNLWYPFRKHEHEDFVKRLGSELEKLVEEK